MVIAMTGAAGHIGANLVRALLERGHTYALRHHQQVSSQKAARELDYRPRPLRETLEDTYGWFRAAGAIP
jgi:nucleoside-diphosphate-sugar epimerase